MSDDQSNELKLAATGLEADLISIQPKIQSLLGDLITPERFIRLAVQAVRKNPLLAQATKDSLFGAIMVCAQLGLEPNTPMGHAWIIPYYNGKLKAYEAQFQTGYKGLIELAYRGGKVKSIQAYTIYDQDKFEVQFGTNAFVKHEPKIIGERGELLAHYAVVQLDNGYIAFHLMRHDEVLAIRNRSKSYIAFANKKVFDTPWHSDFVAMCQKTVLKQALRTMPMSIARLAEAIEYDDSSERGEVTRVSVKTLRTEDLTDADSLNDHLAKDNDTEGEQAPQEDAIAENAKNNIINAQKTHD